MTPHDQAPPASPPRGEPGGPAAPTSFRRSGSQKRQRNRSWRIALTEEEEARALESAARVGLSRSSYGRAALLGTPGPRAQRTPHLHAEVIARATAAINKLGSNFNQIAHVLNAGGAIGMGQQYQSMLGEIRLTLRAIREAVGRKDRDDDNQGESA